LEIRIGKEATGNLHRKYNENDAPPLNKKIFIPSNVIFMDFSTTDIDEFLGLWECADGEFLKDNAWLI
jgi:hypothetical protein